MEIWKYKICPTCKKSRIIYEKIEKDPKTKKKWRITRCQSCDFAFDIVEA